MRTDEAFDLFKANSTRNFCIFGAGGTGKTFLLKRIWKFVTEVEHKTVGLTASTGKAALVLGADLDARVSTIHSWSGINYENKYTDHKAKSIASGMSMSTRSGWKTTDVLVVDEFSQLNKTIYKFVDKIGREVRNDSGDKPFGGVRIIFSGDPYQLAPIRGRSCFECTNWKRTDFIYIELSYPYRYSDTLLETRIMKRPGCTELPPQRQLERIDKLESRTREGTKKKMKASTRESETTDPSRVSACTDLSIIYKESRPIEEVSVKVSSDPAKATSVDITSSSRSSTATSKNSNSVTAFPVSSNERIIGIKRRKSNFGDRWFSILTRMRKGALNDEDFRILSKRVITQHDIGVLEDKCWSSFGSGDTSVKFLTHIYTKKCHVAEHNSVTLNRLKSREFTLTAIDNADVNSTRRRSALLKLDKLADKDIKLKIGAYVQINRNLSSLNLVNGSTGIVDSIDTSRGISVSVRFPNLGAINIPRVQYTDEVGEKIISRHQFPIVLAYAFTSHKVQGSKFLDCAVYIREIFAPGQAYVMLSRVVDMNKLYIVTKDGKIDTRAFNWCSDKGFKFEELKLERSIDASSRLDDENV